MKKIVVMAALASLAACAKPAPTVENRASALESDLVNKAAALDNEASADANAAAATAMEGAAVAYNKSVDSIHAEGEAARNGH